MRNILYTLIASTALATPAMARYGGHGSGGFGPIRIDAVAAQLGVDDATLVKIKGLTYKSEQEAIAIHADVLREQLALRQLMDADKPDEKAIMQQVDKLMVQETRMRKNRIGLLLGVRKLLTPEQRARLEDLMLEHRGRGGPGDPAMGSGGPGSGMGPGMGTGMGSGGGMGRGGAAKGKPRNWR